MSVEAVNQSLNRRLVEMAQVRCTLARFLSEHKRLWVDDTESIDNDFSFHRLYGIYHNGDGSWSKLFKGLLCVYIYG